RQSRVAMPNPKDWFRRRPAADSDAESPDPFASEGVLDLGRAAVMLRDAAPLSVPAPPRRIAEGGRVLRASAFTVRPELARSARPQSTPTARPVTGLSVPPPPPRRAEPLLPSTGRGPVAFRLAEQRRQQVPPTAEAVAAPRPAILTDSTAFTLSAPGPALLRGPQPESTKLHALLRDAFTPTRPKHDAGMFSGRFREMQRIIAAIEEECAHVVVHGERGSGKTSLCNILAGKAADAGYFVVRYACSYGISFEDIFRSLLRRVPGTFMVEGFGLGSRRIENFAQLLPEGAFGISDLVDAFGRIHDRHAIFIIDEYDRVTSDEVKAKLAELIKILSDSAVPVTILLIGVADDVRDLFGKHPSLQRTLVTVPMPLMSRRDLEGLIAAGEAHAGLDFAEEVREAIIEFAQGLPYEAQLLCLFAARSAVRRGSRAVERQDLRYAADRAAEEADQRIKEIYALAVGMPIEKAFEDVLYLAARARSDEFGSFTVADLSAAGPAPEGDGSLLALQYPLKKLTEPERGAVLRRLMTTTGPRYQFCSQMFRNYVLVNQAIARGLV
ncbi:MAG: AAA family ATPase, partial [Stellaceae bacterium]